MANYLKTLRLIPDDIFLAIFAQDFHEDYGPLCICGWAVRESIARSVDMAPEAVDPFSDHTGDIVASCAKRFGGEMYEWETLYYDACSDMFSQKVRVEEAVVDRLNEIVS